jgi:hypothetical protein
MDLCGHAFCLATSRDKIRNNPSRCRWRHEATDSVPKYPFNQCWNRRQLKSKFDAAAGSWALSKSSRLVLKSALTVINLRQN